MKKHIASLLLLVPLTASASAKDLDNSTQSYYGPITICQYEFIDNYPMSAEAKAKIDTGMQARMFRYKHKGHIMCRITFPNEVFRFHSQLHTYGSL
ncbi:hypothetical protein L1077_19980 [Pseudoalteromonas luteoviolacea]|uniref:hypothetical protein n=1 Tax=Pseudoalteromonas luteoviolacea TaxID=43657 RepID=UPI001F1D8280|nr:hypothetical protein [Pseudoalteromonas luteoviolacea]MCF6441719.1 hypothetical protein [Pseudoalteromonas luteoviolacea]